MGGKKAIPKWEIFLQFTSNYIYEIIPTWFTSEMDQIKTISQQVTLKKKNLEQNTTFTPSEKLTLHKSSLQTFKSIYIPHRSPSH